MFANAVEKTEKYTRPLHIVRRFFKTNSGDKERFYRQTAALFFVNDEGVAITCRHVANLIEACDENKVKYNKYREEIKGKNSEEVKDITKKYGYTEKSIVQSIRLFHEAVKPIPPAPDVIKHDTYDLAILKFKNIKEKFYCGHAVLAADSSKLRPGNLMCVYGYPFPEYDNYKIDNNDNLVWSSKSFSYITQPFPQMFMYTRRIKDEDNNNLSYYEFNAPSYKGHSGGPVFDKDGIVYGIGFAVHHYYSEFHKAKVPENYISAKGQREDYTEHHFCHCARAIDADIIKKFLDENGIKYYVEQEEKLPDGRIIIGERAVLPKVSEHK